ncbi:hypothetical protein DPEC_G00141890 [Dallia pectoralis]|uniref:Uncharacterized protein n=1 Tax=Dallia pectoralis TaxID=75939 RepID=A0ACC2GMM0_DALPE|nr:hypothetical protein DPEC_G00141890 [Dallia pectoralis]
MCNSTQKARKGIRPLLCKHQRGDCRMRALSVLVFLAMCGMGVLMYLAIKQELTLRNLKSTADQISLEIKQKENAIVKIKTNIQQLNTELLPINVKRDELTRKKDESVKASTEAKKALDTCNKEKADSENLKTSTTAALQKVKDDTEAEKKKAEQEIEALKKQILDRDKALCTFVDVNMDEGRKLCGLAEAPK